MLATVAKMKDRPIGVFDSGFGGLTVARALIDLLPREDVVYLGDTARYPYGSKPQNEVRDYALQIARLLVRDFNVKALVVACNTAAAAALRELEREFDVPVFSVIEPGVRALTQVTRSGRVGVIGTTATIGSGAYQTAVTELNRECGERRIELVCCATPGFVEFVERGETDSEQMRILAQRLLAPVREAKVDSLLLGCTHYPFLARPIADAVGRDVVLVSSADETAFDVVRRLAGRDLLGSGNADAGTHRWLSSGDTEWFASMGRTLSMPEIDEVDQIVWEEI